MLEKKITIEKRHYNVNIYRKVRQNKEAPRLIVVSYQPNSIACRILKCCLDSIKKFTLEPYELWVIDNCSPKEKISWLLDYPDANIVLNRNKYIENGSYDNGIALEIAKNVIDPDSRFLMSLHMDIMVCKEYWLEYLLSKFDHEIRAVGVRMDKKRVPDGTVHILGAIFDFQLIKKLNISFMPQLPQYDVGDLASEEIKKADFQILSCKNTFNDPRLIQKIPSDSPYRYINIDRAIDDDDDVLFLHLGRGIVKSEGSYIKKGKTTPYDWINFAKNVVLSDSYVPIRLSCNIIPPRYSDIDYSLRRYFVDEFFFRKTRKFKKGNLIIDIGGKKVKKRGQFNIEEYPLKVKYANVDPTTQPDYICDASNIPVEDNFFDGAICAEVLEHVKNPISILEESFRVLRPGGQIFMTIPFLFRIHADPNDYARYTDTYLRSIFNQVGFSNIAIEKQGSFASVFIDMIRSWVLQMKIERRNKILRTILSGFVTLGKKQALKLEKQKYYKYNDFFSSYANGYGITAMKPDSREK